MGLKSKIEIFWSEHRDPILFYTIIIGSIIVITQCLNLVAKANIAQNQIAEENSNQIEVKTSPKEDIENKKLVEQFLEYCKNNKIEEAYNLISDECKKEKYKTLADFKTNYYNKIFNKKRSVEIKNKKTIHIKI